MTSRRVTEGDASAPYKRGIVREVDGAKHKARVEFTDEDGVASWWLHVLGVGARTSKFYAMPAIGDQVACMVDWRGEDGCVLGALYSEVDETPTSNSDEVKLQAESGAAVTFNLKTGTLRLEGLTEVYVGGEKIVLDGVTYLGGEEGAMAVHRVGDRDSDGDVAAGGATMVFAK